MKSYQPSRVGTAFAAIVAVAMCHLPSASANSRTYTANADFDVGTLFNVNHTTPDQLQLNAVATTFPVMWIANAGEDTVSKIDTTTGRELARYRTWFGPSGQPGYFGHIGGAWSGAAPSRTAVDRDGNVYVANRHFDGRPADVIKILATGGIDRNGNGVIDTSIDLDNNGVITNPSAEILPLADTNNNGIIDPNEIQDERIAWVVRVGPNNGLGRSLAIAPNGNIWVGLYNTRAYYELRGSDGVQLNGPIPVPNTPYGALIDANGILWGASLSSSLLKMNTTPPYNAVAFNSNTSNYGIAIGNGRVYLGQGNPYAEFNPATNTFSYNNRGFSTLGIGVDSNGFIVVAGSTVSGSYRGATKMRPSDGSIVWSSGAQGGTTEQRGAIVDSNGDVWTVNRPQSSVSKYRGTDGAPLGAFPVGNEPYTYSDATGLSVQQSNPSGTWTVVHDTGTVSNALATVSWNASPPAPGTTLVVEVRAANTVAGLGAATYAAISNGAGLPPGVVGQFLEVRVSMTGTAGDPLVTPILYDLSVVTNQPPTIVCAAPATAQCPGPIALNFQVGDPNDTSLTYEVIVDGVTVQTGATSPGVLAITHNFTAGAHTVLTRVSDGRLSAQCSTSVTIADTTAPVIACPANITVGTDAGKCSAAVGFAATATDNCGTVNVSYSIAPGSAFVVGTTTVTATATDAAGLTSSCSFTVTVKDTEAPVVACPANISVGTDAGKCSAVVSYAATATDNCAATVSYSIAPGSVFQVGTTTVTATATDAAGLTSSCNFTVTVKDTEAPVIACPANITVGNDLNTCTAVVSYLATATDNCGATVSYSIAPGTVFAKGTTSVTATATDAAGNKSSCTFTVTVNDTQAPVGTCVPTTNPAGNNEPGAKSNGKSGQNPDGFYQLLGTDNCDAASALAVYVKDSGSNYIAGPFKSGDKVKITQAPGVTPNTKPMAGVIVAHIQLKGDALLVVKDAAGNTSVVATCLVPPGPK
jgi:hypothetical protein